MTIKPNNTIPEASSNINPALELARLTKEKLDSFCGTIREDGGYKDRIYLSARSVSNQIADDYSSRFLIELIQNGYDAHPRNEVTGRIKIVVIPSEEEWGVVYVSNTGSPFNLSNVEALCDIGLSDKPVGQTIGNKGLGFRSVSYITDDPQIFSQGDDGAKDAFHGFCFRFASDEDLNQLIAHPGRRERAKEDLPPFHIPICITEQSKRVRDFASEICATVVRLPLRNETSLEVVYKELEDLRSSPAPVMLFLQRLASLEVVVEGHPEKAFVLTRHEQQILINEQNNADRFFSVDLGELGRYFIAARQVPEVDVKKAIKDSITRNQLHAGWEEWEGDGDLALAVRLDDGPISPTLYTYLPMAADAFAPFTGYLHAAFYAKLDRRRIELNITLNRLYFSQAFLLCAKAILAVHRSVTQNQSQFSDVEARKVIVDLLAWNDRLKEQGLGDSAKQLVEAFKTLKVELVNFHLIPIIEGNNSWSAPSKVLRWHRPNLSFFTAERLATTADARIVDPALGAERIERLVSFFKRLGLTLDPLPAKLAIFVENVAKALHQTHAPVQLWQSFYSELDKLFLGNFDVLLGRQILLCSDGKLKAASLPTSEDQSETEAAEEVITQNSLQSRPLVVFLPPKFASASSAGGSEAITNVPKALRTGIAFLDESLQWPTDKMHGGRAFLEKAKLVRNYDTDEVIAYISRRMRLTKSKKIRRQGLLWVFNLYRSLKQSSHPLSLMRARLYVPSLSGDWIRARRAIFSAGWPKETLGPTVSNFIKQTSSTSNDLLDISSRLLASPSTAPFNDHEKGTWVEFLAQLGVTSGLSPVAKETRQMRISGYEFEARALGSRLNLPEASIALWEQEVCKSGGKPHYNISSHEIEGNIWYLPGQSEHELWPEQARIDYAELVLHWLRHAKNHHFSTTFLVRSFPGVSPFKWPTPVAAFLRRASWFPIKMPRQAGGDICFEQLSKVWLHEEGDSIRLPPYLPSLHNQVRKILQRAPELVKLLHDVCGANLWNDDRAAVSQADYMGELYKAVGVESFHLNAFLNTYNKTWEVIANSGETLKWAQDVSTHFILTEHDGKHHTVEVGGHAVRKGGEPSEIYVKDVDDELSVNVIKTLGAHVFDIDSTKTAQIASLLKSALGSRYRGISEQKIEVLIEDKPFTHWASSGLTFVEACPSLPKLILIATECLTGMEAHRLPAERINLIRQLNTIELRLASKVAFKVGDKDVELPSSNFGAVSILDQHRPTVVVISPLTIPGWDELVVAAKPLTSLLRQPALAYPLMSAFRTLQRNGLSITKAHFEVDLLVTELGVEKRRIDHALNSLRGDLTNIRSFLRPLVCYYVNESVMEAFTSVAESAETTAELIQALSLSLSGIGTPPGELISACERSESFPDLRDNLSLDFAKFNRALLAAGESPDLDPAAHKNALSGFIESHHASIMDCLRKPFIDAFDSMSDLDIYIRLRKDLDLLDPDKSWLLDHKIPPDDLLAHFVDEWLIKNGAPRLGSQPSDLEPVSEVSKANKGAVERCVSQAATVVRSWCEKNHVPLPDTWRDNTVRSRIVIALNEVGALDFRRLDDTSIIKWLIRITVWPTNMPPSNSLEDLGLTHADLNKAAEEAKRRQEENERKRRSVDFGGILIDPEHFDSQEFSKQVEEFVTSIKTSGKLGHPANLSSMSPQRPNPTGGGGGGGSNMWRERVHPKKKELIGFMGEYVVYNWLQKTFPKKDIDRAWVSSNRTKMLPGEGNDGLGYDFEIHYLDKKWHLEVKASTGDPSEFELGETEVRKARDCARSKRDEYYIIYVSNLNTPSQVKIEQLPNPMSDSNNGLYRLVGEGIRYKFLRS